MKILVATDAWHPQVNGVVRTLGHTAREASALGHEVEFLTHEGYRTLPLPTYSEIRLALPPLGAISKRIDAFKPDAIHIATEGSLGHIVRRICIRRKIKFTTSLHTRFPDYVADRLLLPARWSADLTWAILRRFHSPSSAVLAATPSLAKELTKRRFPNVRIWQRGVDADLFCPRVNHRLPFKSPIFLTVGRVAVEKNVEAFLKLDLPGTKVVVGDGPQREILARRYPDAVFFGAKYGQELAEIYASADVFVFPSLTDTFGLVLLEALASGVPVAAFPAAAPRDVIGDAAVGALDNELKRACLSALECSREECRNFALGMTWAACAKSFIGHVAQAVGTVDSVSKFSA
jgi:glycosyltransferase involved in cell wall biosynthesis